MIHRSVRVGPSNAGVPADVEKVAGFFRRACLNEPILYLRMSSAVGSSRLSLPGGKCIARRETMLRTAQLDSESADAQLELLGDWDDLESFAGDFLRQPGQFACSLESFRCPIPNCEKHGRRVSLPGDPCSVG